MIAAPSDLPVEPKPAPTGLRSGPSRAAASRLQLVQLGQLLAQQNQQCPRVLHGQVQGARSARGVLLRASRHQGIHVHFDQASVVLQLLDALHFNVVGLQWRSPAMYRRRFCAQGCGVGGLLSE